MIILKNQAQFEAQLEAAVRQQLMESFLPVAKAVVYEMAEAFVVGDEGYAGTPEWTGNAAANWYLTTGQPATEFREFFDDPEYPLPEGGESPYSGHEPRKAAVRMSMDRIRRALDQIQDPNVTLYVTNTAPYLADYQPYGEGAKFRVANLWPMSPARNVVRTINSLRTASYMQVQAWKKGVPRWSK